LIVVPYATFHELAARIPADDSRLICIHNIGRCGSTLLSQVFNEVDSVVSLSEPDVFANFVALRSTPRPELIRLLHSSLCYVFRPAVTGSAATYALKFRNQCVDLIDLFFDAFPQARHLFMYRDALGWLASVNRLINQVGPLPPLSRDEAIDHQALYMNRDRAEIEHFYDPAITSYPVIVYLAVGWLVMMSRYLELYEQGFRPLAVRYADLNKQREAVVTKIFEHCGLPADQVATALRAFDRDSQAETRLARDNAEAGNRVPIPDDLIAQIQVVLSRQSVINHSDYVLPGTLSLVDSLQSIVVSFWFR
jgi:hypothetical protein